MKFDRLCLKMANTRDFKLYLGISKDHKKELQVVLNFTLSKIKGNDP